MARKTVKAAVSLLLIRSGAESLGFRDDLPSRRASRKILPNLLDCILSNLRSRAALQLEVVVLHHERRRIVHCGVTARPTSLWASQQVRETFPWQTAPRYLIRDRDGVPSS